MPLPRIYKTFSLDMFINFGHSYHVLNRTDEQRQYPDEARPFQGAEKPPRPSALPQTQHPPASDGRAG